MDGFNFENIWNLQKKFNEGGPLKDIDLTDKNQVKEWNNFFSLAMMKEVNDALSETDWKVHREKSHHYIRTNHLLEFADCFKYLICLLQLNNFTPKDLEEAFYKKSRVVEQLYKQEKLSRIVDSDRPVIGVDIDGVLADYYKDYPEFMKEFFNLEVDLPESDKFPYSDVNKFFVGYEKKDYIEVKDRYRQSGRKSIMPICKGAKEFLEKLKEKGYLIVLLTARPMDKYKIILSDTIEWLERNSLPYDCILWGEKKEERLIEEFNNKKIKFFVDDLAKNANSISELGVPCYLLNKEYNKNDMIRSSVVRVNSLEEILKLIDD